MASNEAPNSPSQQQSVLQQLWEQQSAQYYWYWRPGLVSQTPARNMHAQQPNLAYPSPTHNGNQPIPPILRSAQYEGGSDQTYATQVIAPYRYPYPHLSQYSPVMTMPAYVTHQYNYSAPFTNAPNYFSPYYGAPVTSSYQGGVGFQPWGVQQYYGWTGFRNGWPEPSDSYGIHHGDNLTNSDGATSPRLGYNWCQHSGRSPQPSSQERDNYRPTYTDSSPREERSADPYYQHPRRALVAAKSGPPGKHSDLSRAMSPLSAYLPQRQQSRTWNMEAPALSDSLPLARAITPLIANQTLETLPLETESVSVSCQSLESSNHESNSIAKASQEVQAPPQCSLANALNQKLNDTTTVAESHLSESKVQINSQPEFAASAKFTTRMFHEAFEPVKLHADNEPTSTETAPGSVGHVRASLLEDTGVSQTDLSIELTQTRLAKDTEPSHIDSTVKRAMMPRSATAESPEGIFTHDDAQTMYKTSSKATQPGATDNIQHSVPSVAVEFDTAKTNKKPDDVDLLSAEGVEELAQTIRDKLTKSTTDTSAITSSPVPMMSKSVNHFPSRKRTKPRNWKQKRATAKLDSIHPSGLNLSRNQDDDASQLSPSTTDSSNVSPPTKRIKEEPISSPTNNQHPSLAPPPRQNAWLNFATIIKQDDDKLKAKLEDERERERKAGNKFRPEIKETYKHQKGRTETVVHEKVGAPAVVKSEDSADVVMKKEGLDGGGSVGGVQIESETSSEVEVKAE